MPVGDQPEKGRPHGAKGPSLPNGRPVRSAVRTNPGPVPDGAEGFRSTGDGRWCAMGVLLAGQDGFCPAHLRCARLEGDGGPCATPGADGPELSSGPAPVAKA